MSDSEDAAYLLTQGRAGEAADLLARAVAVQPTHPILRELYGYALQLTQRQVEANAQYEAALQRDPHLRFAHLNYAQTLLASGQHAEALAHLEAGYKPVAGVVDRYRGSGKPLRVLQLGSALVDGLTATDRILCGDFCETTTIAVQYWEPLQPLPPCDLIFNSIADPDLCEPALEIAQWLLRTAQAPILNPPAAIRETGRVTNAQRLRNISNLVMPKAERFTRAALSDPSAFAFPLLLRSPGFHNGKNFELVERPLQLSETLDRLPGNELLVIEYVDLKIDGRVRKYRAMVIEGKLYPAHLAISNDWKVHYFSATMTEADRAEEAAYLEDMQAAIGERAYVALQHVAQTLNLDYLGIDFALTPTGEAVIFEANAAMTVYLPEPSPQTEYRRTAAQNIYRAAQSMIRSRSTKT